MADKETEDIAVLFSILIAGALLGYGLFYFAVGVPKVGIIRIDGIIDSGNADQINTMLKYAGQRRDIRAVVLEINSPGGGAISSEDIYLNVLGLRSKKPVVASINDIGASGAYFIKTHFQYREHWCESNISSKRTA